MRKRDTSDYEVFDAYSRTVAWAISPKNPLVRELGAIDELLDEAPEVLDLVHADLSNPSKKRRTGGRPTQATSEQVLRSAILMQLRGLHYRQLAEEIDASIVYRKFTRFYGKKIPHFTRLNDLIKMIAAELEKIVPLAETVYDQAHRRVILGERVAAEKKIISIFETHTDIICRGKKGSKTEFGHKFDVATGRSGLITFYRVYKGNPCDGGALEHHKRLFGRAPERFVADRRYHSEKNERIAAGAGVKQVALPKPGRLSEVRKSLQKARWFRRLMRWRAGIEGHLSTLLRSFGLKRCLWRGWRSFQAYVGLGSADLQPAPSRRPPAGARRIQTTQKSNGEPRPANVSLSAISANRRRLGLFVPKGSMF